MALNRSLEIAGKADELLRSLATRGENLVKRIRTQKATKDLVAQAETTVALGKGAVTTVRKAAADIERSAKATLTTGRHQAARPWPRSSPSSVAEETREVTQAEATESAKRTRTAAKRTATTTKKRRQAATSRPPRRATTSARKTAAAAKKASADGRREGRRLS